MHPDYESVAFSLDVYEVSDVLELEEGCYVIMRVEKDREDVAPNAYQLIDQYRYAVVKGLVDAQREEISFEGNEYFDSLNLVEIE